jgi:hypothetical protein
MTPRLHILPAAALVGAVCGCGQSASGTPAPSGPTCAPFSYIEGDACVPLEIADGKVAEPSTLDAADSDGDAPSAALDAEADAHAPMDGPPLACTWSLSPAASAPATLGGLSIISVADMDGDGRLDLVAASTIPAVPVFLGAGDGTFLTGIAHPVDAPVDDLAIADLDRDGTLDIVTVNHPGATGDGGGPKASVLLGNGNGTLESQTALPVGSDATSVAIADFNGDAKHDLVLATGVGASVLLGNGDGTFQAAVAYPAGPSPMTVAVGDLDRDGNPDLIVAEASSRVYVLRGVGDGTFVAATAWNSACPLPGRMASGDMNGDGNTDVVVICNAGFAVLLGGGDGTLRTPTLYLTDQLLSSVAIGDVDGDGKPDVAVKSAENDLVILLGLGDGTFGPPMAFGGGSQSGFVALGDLNEDGKEDFAVSSGSDLAVYLGSCTP